MLKNNCFVEIVWTKLWLGLFYASKLKKYRNIHGYKKELEKENNGLIPFYLSADSPETKDHWVSAKKSVNSKPIFLPLLLQTRAN